MKVLWRFWNKKLQFSCWMFKLGKIKQSKCPKLNSYLCGCHPAERQVVSAEHLPFWVWVRHQGLRMRVPHRRDGQHFCRCIGFFVAIGGRPFAVHQSDAELRLGGLDCALERDVAALTTIQGYPEVVSYDNKKFEISSTVGFLLTLSLKTGISLFFDKYPKDKIFLENNSLIFFLIK